MAIIKRKFFVFILCVAFLFVNTTLASEKKDFIKWIDFGPTEKAMSKALDYDISSYGDSFHLNWIEILAYLGAKYGGNFLIYKDKDMENLVDKLKSGQEISQIVKDMKHYEYYLEAYTAVLASFVGEFTIQKPGKDGEVIWEKTYGLKVFSPIAKNYNYTHSNDFGVARSYGYKREHLGHDLFAQLGAPIIAVESGVVEMVGWNQFGGWRIGIRSFDGKRYYYYAHLKKDKPYHDTLGQGQAVKAGDVIGYLGRTGYSSKENFNGIKEPHLHFGMQIIFDESQKDSKNEIWIDLYEITKFLRKNKSLTHWNENLKDYYRTYDFFEEDTLQ